VNYATKNGLKALSPLHLRLAKERIEHENFLYPMVSTPTNGGEKLQVFPERA
jgi:hypothetical protein